MGLTEHSFLERMEGMGFINPPYTPKKENGVSIKMEVELVLNVVLHRKMCGIWMVGEISADIAAQI